MEQISIDMGVMSTQKIMIIIGTNRTGSKSKIIGEYYQEMLQEMGVGSEIIELAALPKDFVFSALYENNGKNEAYNQFHQKLASGNKFVFIVPEYNGSFPGVLKAFIDGMGYPNVFRSKKCAMIGLSSGIGGGGHAMSHLTDIMNYLGMHVLALKPKLAKIEQNMSGNLLTNRLYMELLRSQAEMLIDF
jgi:chromate reductase, NAD(P)H dehydrogenase (quinone)